MASVVVTWWIVACLCSESPFPVSMIQTRAVSRAIAVFSCFQRNTFQAAVVTDEEDTYVVYNYYNITWAGSIRQGCNPQTGTGPNCFEAQVK